MVGVRIPGGWPALTIAALTVFGAVGAAPSPATLGHPQVHDAGIRPLAAVAPPPGHVSGAAAVTAATLAAPPAAMVNTPGVLGIPAIALAAYRNAERLMAGADPACGVSWNLLAGIGRIESMHANGGATDADGNAMPPIFGPALDGSLAGNEIIVQSRGPSGVQYARALGPMQFLPGTWARFASDGNGDGTADVQNVFDAALGAARYLCSGALNLRDPMQVLAAVLRYNNSISYAENVLGWAAAYATGVVPVDMPPITGPIPPMGDARLDGGAPEGAGSGMPIDATGLPPTYALPFQPPADPLAKPPVQFGTTDSANEFDPGESRTCVVTCLGRPSAFGQSPGHAALAPSTLPGRAQTGSTQQLDLAPSGQPSSAGQSSARPASTRRPTVAGPGGADAPTPDAQPSAPIPRPTVTALSTPTLPSANGPVPGVQAAGPAPVHQPGVSHAGGTSHR
jgi:Transglycosylase SLT domain